MCQDEFNDGIDFVPSTFGSIIATTGARATGLFGLVAIFISGYQGYAYDKSSLKRFYKEVNIQHGFGEINGAAINSGSDDYYYGHMRM